MRKSLLNRVVGMEKSLLPTAPEIDTSIIEALEERGYPIMERVTDEKPLDYSSQDSFTRSVFALLTIPELRELSQNYSPYK